MYKNQWAVIDSYLNSEGSLVEHQLASYNLFITSGIPDVIESCGDLVIKNPADETIHTVSFTNPRFIMPVKQLHEYHNMNTTKECDLLPFQATITGIFAILTFRCVVSINLESSLTTVFLISTTKLPEYVKFCVVA